MLFAAHNLLRFDHVPQLPNFGVLVPTKCRCCCAQFDNAAFNLLAHTKTLTIYWNGIRPKCAPDVILLSLADELSFVKNCST